MADVGFEKVRIVLGSFKVPRFDQAIGAASQNVAAIQTDVSAKHLSAVHIQNFSQEFSLKLLQRVKHQSAVLRHHDHL